MEKKSSSQNNILVTGAKGQLGQEFQQLKKKLPFFKFSVCFQK